jgi:hypothetical protein
VTVGAERVALLYMAMDDDDAVRRRLLAGEYSDEEAAELSAYERKLLTDAATEDLPDVTGYDAGGPKVSFWAPYRHITLNYVGLNLTDPSLQASFLDFQNSSAANPEG